MSKETLQAVHDAIAAHIADANEDDPEYLTEWAFVAAAAVSSRHDRTAYYYYDSDIPSHHATGLLHTGLEFITRGGGWATDDED